MESEIRKGLTDGLLTGYAGQKKPEEIVRGGFRGKASHVDEGFAYHDEWFTDNYLGGGQELLEINGEKFTRLYAGGTPVKETLDQLGITGKDVSKYLKSKIQELSDNTRLTNDCLPKKEEGWEYSYKVTSYNESIGVTTGMETITYQGEIVHIHAFILSPIK